MCQIWNWNFACIFHQKVWLGSTVTSSQAIYKRFGFYKIQLLVDTHRTVLYFHTLTFTFTHLPTPPQHTYTHPYTHIHTHTWMWIRTYLFLGEYCQTYWDSKRKSGIHGTTIKDAAIKKNSAVAYTPLYAARVLLLCCGLNTGLAARAFGDAEREIESTEKNSGIPTQDQTDACLSYVLC